MLKFTFDAQSVFDHLDRARATLDDMTPIHEDIREYMIKSTKDRFRTSTAPDGTRWRDKTQATLATYLGRGDGKKRRGGFKPLIGPSRRLGNEIVGYASPNSTEIGSALEYSAVMQEGAKKGAFGKDRAGHPLPWGDIPARVFIGISETEERNILDIVDRHLAPFFGE